MSTEWWIRIIIGVTIIMFVLYVYTKKHLAEYELLKQNNKLLQKQLDDYETKDSQTCSSKEQMGNKEDQEVKKPKLKFHQDVLQGLDQQSKQE